jgi:hypothetical protein
VSIPVPTANVGESSNAPKVLQRLGLDVGLQIYDHSLQKVRVQIQTQEQTQKPEKADSLIDEIIEYID